MSFFEILFYLFMGSKPREEVYVIDTSDLNLGPNEYIEKIEVREND